MAVSVTLQQVEEARRNIAPIALRTPLVRPAGSGRIAAIVSGGNIDLDKFADIVNWD